MCFQRGRQHLKVLKLLPLGVPSQARPCSRAPHLLVCTIMQYVWMCPPCLCSQDHVACGRAAGRFPSNKAKISIARAPASRL